MIGEHAALPRWRSLVPVLTRKHEPTQVWLPHGDITRSARGRGRRNVQSKVVWRTVTTAIASRERRAVILISTRSTLAVVYLYCYCAL